MSDRVERRPYRVVFVRADDPERRGVIVASDAQAAHREATSVADAGGLAEVQYIDAHGDRRVLAMYGSDGDGHAAGPALAPD